MSSSNLQPFEPTRMHPDLQIVPSLRLEKFIRPVWRIGASLRKRDSPQRPAATNQPIVQPHMNKTLIPASGRFGGDPPEYIVSSDMSNRSQAQWSISFAQSYLESGPFFGFSIWIFQMIIWWKFGSIKISFEWNRAISRSASTRSTWKAIYWNQLE